MPTNTTYCSAIDVSDLVGDIISNADESVPNMLEPVHAPRSQPWKGL